MENKNPEYPEPFINQEDLQKVLNEFPEWQHKYIKEETERQLNILKEHPFKKGDERRILLERIKKYIPVYNETPKPKAPEKIFTAQGQAEDYIEKKPIFYDKAGLWWMWNEQEKFWEMTDEVDILNYIQEVDGSDIITPKIRTIILNSLKQEGRKNIPKPMKKSWIQFKDIVFDIETGKEFPASPEYFVTNPIPYSLHQERFIETPTMDKIFEEWVGKDYVRTLYEIIAYCLIPDYPIHRLFCFIGGGMNGKSCYLRLLQKFVGLKNVTATELDVLLHSRFEITRLHKKLVCMMGETNFAEMSQTSIIKKITGQDLIGFEYKNKTPFDDRNYAKILIATNNLPTTTDKTIGFYRRWLIIDFPNQFSEEKDILAEIPEEEYECLAVKCLGILKELLEAKKFHNEGNPEDRMKRYEDKSNFFDKFWKENIIEDLDSYITVKDFENKLHFFCNNNKQRTLTAQVIHENMENRGIEQGKPYMEWWENDKSIKKQVRAWVGIKWK